ncbi:AraC family transcriptional regulator [Marinomonas posidonica]|uniref:Transcriptional regulator, AraC family n=1 Tax=Marinomonas posidonica (strain CECT 7376 / NCIMB 14433 / IVIA-Po-181) TaxID=491952 RepID=F6CUP8_MARPP|nr:AraC family transcriptional regulator [Marinomonas posidonica]AEF54158.1 transcriptional regulator, AraC family [Marinomonas posidonica IVIA-Po-181]
MDRVQHFTSPDPCVSLISGHYQSFEFDRHYHLDYHFGLILEGQQAFASQGERHRVGPGDIIIMPPDVLHDGQAMLDSGYKTQVFSVEPHWFNEMHITRSSQGQLTFTDNVIQDPIVFQSLTQAYMALCNEELSQLARDCLPFEGFSPLVERYGQSHAKPIYALGKSNLERLRAFLLAHLAEPVSLQQLADLCHLSPSQFQRQFKAKVGMTPYAWFSRLRLEQAMKLLKAKIPGTDVAQQVGFYDQAHFSKAFKHSFGVSPSQIR